MKSVQPFLSLFTMLRDGENFEVHKIILSYLESIKNKPVAMIALITPYRAAFDYLDIVFKQYKKYIESQKITASNIERKNSYMSLKRAVESAVYSMIPDIKAAGDVLSLIINNYKNVNRKPYADATGIYYNLIQDFTNEQNNPHTVSLQLEDTVADLKRHNEDFEAYYSSRSNKKEERRILGAIKTARRETDLVFKELVTYINSAYLINEQEMHDDVRETLFEDIINKLNGYIAQARMDYYRHVKTNDPRKKKHPAKPKQPKPYEMEVVAQEKIWHDKMSLTAKEPKKFAKALAGKLEGSVLKMKRKNDEDTGDFAFAEYTKDAEDNINGLIVAPPEGLLFFLDIDDYEAEYAYIEKDGVRLANLQNAQFPELQRDPYYTSSSN